MNPEKIFNEIQVKENELSRLTTELNILGRNKEIKEREYRIAKAKEMTMLSNNKVKISILNDLVRGKEEIANLRFERNMAVNSYYICKTAIENKRLEIEVRRSQLTWLRVELTV